ncbi:MAG: pentapeptide repeat-containing protein [Cyanobacteriota bacterium]
MSGEPGIKVEKHRSAWRKEIKVNPKGLFMSLGKAAINGAFLKWDDLAENGVEVLESLGLEAKSGEIAGLLIVRSLIQAIKDLLKENKELLIKKPDNVKVLYSEIHSSLEQGELVIDQSFFQRPKDLQIVQAAKTGFAKWLEAFVEKKVEAENISNRLPAYFVFALNEEWRTHKQDYANLKEELDTPFTQASEREQGWLRYRAWLQKRVDEPMFLESFSLKQVYVELRAYYKREVEGQPKQKLERGTTETKQYERVLVDLNRELETWLQEAKPDDAIRLISGGPGSGKSSFAKIFAAQQAEKGEIPVLFIPLHLFKLSDDLVKAVGEFVQLERFLPHNPLDRGDGESRLLIIFDGLDELSMQGKVAEEAAKQFVEEVRYQVDRFNTHQPRLQVLISGRELVLQANLSKFRKPYQILHLCSYFVAEEEREGENKNYVDDANLLKQDQRQLWWQLYGEAKGKDYRGLPPELDRPNLVEITAQPLLNYLVALSIERDKLQFSNETNLNEIYGDLLEAVYERGYEKHGYRVTEGIEKHEFIGILEEIALACWHGVGRTTTVREIENHCNNSGVKDILTQFQASFKEDSKASVTRLLTAFYFRESGGIRASEKTFEFTHKSFGEYLTAKRIVEEVQLIHEALEERKKNFRKGCDAREALARWITLCNLSEMDEYLFQFIYDEIRLQNLSDVQNWQKSLCRLIEFMIVDGLPLESKRYRDKFDIELFQARNTEEALLAVLNACARVTKESSEIKWEYRNTFGAWISRLQGQRIGVENVLALKCLSFLDLQNCILYVRDFINANFAFSNLKNAELNFANLLGSNLTGVNFQEAILSKAILAGANLVKANLSQANLSQANLEEANLEEANLAGAILQGAILYKANLQGANLQGANLQWVNLYEANLEGTILEGANLEGANLTGTILEGKDIASLTEHPNEDSEEP